MTRDVRLTFRLSAGEVAKLDEFRGAASRSAFVRRLIADVEPRDVSGVLTYSETLAALSEMTAAGKVSAAIALARELRGAEQTDDVPAWLRD